MKQQTVTLKKKDIVKNSVNEIFFVISYTFNNWYSQALH